jgi:D-amino-acid dehydrogenase
VLSERTRNEFELEQGGLLALFQTEHGLAERRGTRRAPERSASPAEVLDARASKALEPGLTPDVIGGVHYPLAAHVTPQKFHAALTRLVRERDGEFRFGAEVHSWERDGGSIRAAATSAGRVEADEFVVAAGVWSARLVRSLGIPLPLQPGKGYSLTLQNPRERPRRAVLLQECRVALTPMGTTLRVGGTMEVGASDSRINPPRIRGILSSLMRHLPAFRPEDFRDVTPWSGLRPLSPDGLPYVGRFRRFQNLSVAAGHAMMGLSMSTITGELIAQTLSGERPSVDMTLLSPDRDA